MKDPNPGELVLAFRGCSRLRSSHSLGDSRSGLTALAEENSLTGKNPGSEEKIFIGREDRSLDFLGKRLEPLAPGSVSLSRGMVQIW